jgi:large subunit ribosomal protein L13
MAVINAENCVAGRLASIVAKRLLKGEEIMLINAEKAIVNGDPEAISEFFEEKIKRGDPYHGPFYPKTPERILRRIIRGMLPFHKPRGRDAYKRLKVYVAVPDDLKKEKAEVASKALSKAEAKFVYLRDVAKRFE